MYGNDLCTEIQIDSINSVHTCITIFTNTKRNGDVTDRLTNNIGQLTIDTELVVEFIWSLRPISISYPDLNLVVVQDFLKLWHDMPPPKETS